MHLGHLAPTQRLPRGHAWQPFLRPGPGQLKGRQLLVLLLLLLGWLPLVGQKLQALAHVVVAVRGGAVWSGAAHPVAVVPFPPGLRGGGGGGRARRGRLGLGRRAAGLPPD